MEGKIKWINKEKGYGFISTPDSKDRFFHITNVVGDDLPNNGDVVTFDPETRKDGKLVAIRVSITKAKENNREHRMPYYASGEYSTYSYIKQEGTRTQWGISLAIVFAIITDWVFDGGLWWALFLLLLVSLSEYL